MSKYDQLKVFRKTKARIIHTCSRCGRTIEPGEYYFREYIDFVKHFFEPKKLCCECHEKCPKRTTDAEHQ